MENQSKFTDLWGEPPLAAEVGAYRLSRESVTKKDIFLTINKSFVGYGISAGILAILSYGIVVWSMQYLQIAYVSSIRETSIIIATLIGFFVLGEKKAKGRIVPALLVVAGIAILYLQI